MNRLVGVALALAVLVIFTGLIALRKISQPANDSSQSWTPKNSTLDDTTLESVRDTFRKGVDIESCRAAVQQFNLYLARNPDKKPAPLSKEEQELLTSQFRLDADELAEVSGGSLTPLDAHH